MSDQVDWWTMGTVGVFGTAAALQFGMAVNELRKVWASGKPKREPTDYEKVLNGATIGGWSLVLPATAGLNKETNEMIYYGPVDPIFTDPTCEKYPVASSDTAITLQFMHPSVLDNSKVFSIRQYRPFQKTEEILFRTRYWPRRMRPVLSTFVTPRLILMAFEISPPDEEETRQFDMILLETTKRQSSKFRMEAPGRRLLCAYVTESPSPHLHIVFFETGDESIEFFDCKFDLPLTTSGQVWWTQDSIFIRRRMWPSQFCFNLGCAVVFVAADDANPDDVNSHLCIWIDHTQTWEMASLAEWLKSMEKTGLGSMIMQASKTLGALSPPREWNSINVRAIRYLERLSPRPRGKCVLGVTDCEGVLRRWLSTPPLKQVAVETLFKSNPGLEMETLKTALGTALFEALFEDGTRPTVKTTPVMQNADTQVEEEPNDP